MNLIICYLLSITNVAYSFVPAKYVKFNNLLNLQSKNRKVTKFNHLTISDIEYYEDYYYDVKYNNNYVIIDDNILSKKSKPKINFNTKSYQPRGINQENYVKCLEDNDKTLIFATGPAGSGKTLFACINAIKSLKDKSISKIILTRPIVPVDDEEIGYLPGDIKHKMDPWLIPIFDIFLEYYKQTEIDQMIHDSIIEITPLSFLRGRTFKKAIVIADEMQNSTPNQMLMLCTRIGENSKMIICGDLMQSDRSIDNGLSDIIDKLYKSDKKFNNIEIIEMNESDIQRSQIVKDILELYNKV